MEKQQQRQTQPQRRTDGQTGREADWQRSKQTARQIEWKKQGDRHRRAWTSHLYSFGHTLDVRSRQRQRLTMRETHQKTPSLPTSHPHWLSSSLPPSPPLFRLSSGSRNRSSVNYNILTRYKYLNALSVTTSSYDIIVVTIAIYSNIITIVLISILSQS